MATEENAVVLCRCRHDLSDNAYVKSCVIISMLEILKRFSQTSVKLCSIVFSQSLEDEEAMNRTNADFNDEIFYLRPVSGICSLNLKGACVNIPSLRVKVPGLQVPIRLDVYQSPKCRVILRALPCF